MTDTEILIADYTDKIAELEKENEQLKEKIASIGNPIYLSVSTFEADYPEPYSNVIRANRDDTWKDIEMPAKAKFFDALYKQGYIKRVQNKDNDVQTLYCMRVVK